MKKMINQENIAGYIYQHNLTIKTVQNQASSNFGKEFISGELEIAVDEEGLNVVPVHFTYVTAETKTGTENKTYTALKKIIDDNRTWIEVGKDNAQKVKINTAISLNDFYNQNNELVSAKINEGGFITLTNTLNEKEDRNKFTCDMFMTQVSRIETDPEKNIESDYVRIKGAIFNFRNELLPVEFFVRNEQGMEYFEGLEVSQSNPIFTKVWGKIECRTEVKEIKEESAFGESSVRTYEKKTKEWIVTGAQTVPYDFGDESVLTADELKKAMQDRETKLAEIKTRSEEYKAQKAAQPSVVTVTTTTSTTVPAGDFNF